MPDVRTLKTGETLTVTVSRKKNGIGLTGLTISLLIMRLSDSQYWTGLAWSATPTELTMTEKDSTNFPGDYEYTTGPVVASSVNYLCRAYITSGVNAFTVSEEVQARPVAWATNTLLNDLSSVDAQAATAAALAAYNTTGVATEASVLNIQNNTNFVASIANYYIIPESSFTMYKIRVCLYDNMGNMEDPDSNEFGLRVENASAVDRSGLLYKDATGSVLLDDSTFTNYKHLERESVGVYFCFIKIASTAAVEQLMYDFIILENTVQKRFSRTNQAITAEPGSATLADNATNATIVAKALKTQDVSAIPAVTGSIEKDILDAVGDAIKLTDIIDGTETVGSSLKKLLAYAIGDSDLVSLSDVTYKDQGGLESFTVRITPTTRRRVS